MQPLRAALATVLRSLPARERDVAAAALLAERAAAAPGLAWAASLRKRSSSRRGPPLLSVWRTVNGDFRACWLACRSCVGGRVGSGRGAAAGTPRLLLSRL